MSMQLGQFNLPTLGDAVGGTEAMLGNIIEGIIEASTGAVVELTPGNGVDNTKVSGPKGSGDLKFDKKMASHEDVERLAKQMKKSLEQITRDVAKIKVRMAHQQPTTQQRPPTWGQQMQPPMYGPYPSAPPMGMNPLMLLLLMQQHGDNNDFARSPFGMLVLTQALQGASIGSVGGQPINIDLTTIALLSSAFGFMRDPPPAQTVVTPTPRR